MIKLTRKLGVNEVFWILYFLMIALPLHASNKILTYLSVTGMISIFHILLGCMFIWLCCRMLMKERKVISKKNLWMILFAILLFESVCIGVKDSSHVFNNVIGDGIMYFMSFAILWIVRSKYFRPVEIRWFLKWTFKAMTVNLFINVLMYLTQSLSFWGLQSYNGGRFGGGYLSLLVVTIIYGVYDYLYEKNISTWHLAIHVFLAIVCSMLAQSRTHVILCFLGCLLLFVPMGRRLSKKYFVRLIILALIGGIGVYSILNGNSELVQRILNMDVTSNTETTASRLITWIYYWRLIRKAPFGTGFGEIMYFINPSMTIARATSTYYVDNALAVVLYKCGWSCGILYFLFIIITPVRLFTNWKKKFDKVFLLFVIIFLMLILSTMILTSQVIHTYAVNVFIWTTVALTYRWSESVCTDEGEDIKGF